MLNDLRLKITWLFVVSTTSLFFTLGLLGGWAIDSALNMSLDEELSQLAAEIYPILNLAREPPTMEHWKSQQHPSRLKLLAHIQIFDAAGNIVEEHGTKDLIAVPGLRLDHSGVKQMLVAGKRIRIYCQPLRNTQAQIIGWLQISRSTSFQQGSLMQYGITLLLLTIVVWFSSLNTGYLVTGRALMPVRQNLEVLRCFVANAGHELRTPLTLLQGSVEELEMATEHSESLNHIVAAIAEASNKMNRLVSDLLLLSKLESSPHNVYPRSKVNLTGLIQEVAGELLPLFKEKTVSLTQELTPQDCWCHASSMKKAVGNLLKNALAYTPAGGRVVIILKSNFNSIDIVVSDSGEGIPPEHLSKIFDRFYRGSRSEMEPGCGLGLSIAQAVVKDHGGTIKVQSRVGHGSSFTINLPKSMGLI